MALDLKPGDAVMIRRPQRMSWEPATYVGQDLSNPKAHWARVAPDAPLITYEAYGKIRTTRMIALVEASIKHKEPV